MPLRTNLKPQLAVIGGSGMLGGDLVRYLAPDFSVTAIDRENYRKHAGTAFDVIVNANGNSRRFWANKHLAEDFEASTFSVYRTFEDFSSDMYVYISSSDTYPDHASPATTKEDQFIDSRKLSPYGLHKYLSEQIVRNRAEKFIILRCSLMLGSTLKKGPVFDILDGKPLFVTLSSRLQMITTHAIASVIATLLEKKFVNDVFNLGGRGAFPFSDAERFFGTKAAIAPDADEQIYEMSVEKLNAVYSLKTSREYLQDFLDSYNQGAS